MLFKYSLSYHFKTPAIFFLLRLYLQRRVFWITFVSWRFCCSLYDVALARMIMTSFLQRLRRGCLDSSLLILLKNASDFLPSSLTLADARLVDNLSFMAILLYLVRCCDRSDDHDAIEKEVWKLSYFFFRDEPACGSFVGDAMASFFASSSWRIDSAW